LAREQNRALFAKLAAHLKEFASHSDKRNPAAARVWR